MNAAVFFLRSLVRLIGWIFRVSEQTATAIVVSFHVGVLAGVLLLSVWHTPNTAQAGAETHSVQQYAQSRRVPDTHRRLH